MPLTPNTKLGDYEILAAIGAGGTFRDEVPESGLSASPKLSRDATRAGVILGTAASMSPEHSF